MASDQYSRDVFVNCPFDSTYRPLFHAALFTIFACGYGPRCALEVADSGEVRIAKILKVIRNCQLGIHDISRTELDPAVKLPRFNMPLELGLFLGAREFGDDHQRRKKCLILDIEPYRYQKFCSDIAGQDIQSHNSESLALIKIIRDWIHNLLGDAVRRRTKKAPLKVIPGHKIIVEKYEEFRKDLPSLCSKLGLDDSDLGYSDFESIASSWLKENPWEPVA